MSCISQEQHQQRLTKPAVISLLPLLILMILMPSPADAMCFEPLYRMHRFYVQEYRAAPFITVGRVSDVNNNRTHQSFRFSISCVYKAPTNKNNLFLGQTLSFVTEYSEPCSPKVVNGEEYLILFKEIETRRKKERRRKKKKKNSRVRDFTRIIIATPVPISEVSESATGFSQIIHHTKVHEPVGQCYNVWSPWSACTQKCSVGEMTRTYGRYNKTPFTQRAVCYNAPCESHSSITNKDAGQNQPVKDGNCKSIDLVAVKWCNRHYSCAQDSHYIHTALTWKLAPVLMTCQETTGEESLQYRNVAVPSECGCSDTDSSNSSYQYAIIDSPSDPFSNPGLTSPHNRRSPVSGRGRSGRRRGKT